MSTAEKSFARTYDDSTDDESSTMHETRFSSISGRENLSNRKRNNVPTQIIHHPSLKPSNRSVQTRIDRLKNVSQRMATSTILHPDFSDRSLSQRDHFSRSIFSNLGSDYDNVYASAWDSEVAMNKMKHSQFFINENEQDQSKSQYYF